MMLRTALMLLVASTLTAAPREPDPVEQLVKELKLTPAASQLEPNRWTGGGAQRLGTFQKLWDDWRGIDATAVAAGKDSLASAGSFEKSIATASPFIDLKPLPPASEKQAPSPAADFPKAVAALHAELGKPLTDEQSKDLAARSKDVPPDVAAAAAALLRAVPGALKKRSHALAKLGGPEKWAIAFDRARNLGQNYAVDAESLKLLADIDLAALVQGGQELGRSMDFAATLLAKPADGPFSFTWQTPIGSIRLNGTQANEYGVEPSLLIIDVGGKDRYASAAGTQSAADPISLLLDLGGDDTYESKKGPAFGAGVLGYGFLFDSGGDDLYRADQFACGTASFGIGILMDCAGRDMYELDRIGQGAAAAGIGVLSDLDGNDSYRCFQEAQGFAAVRGCGVLIDRRGDDQYEADNTKIRYPSAQDPKHNVSLAQGCGFGFRDHPGAGNSLAGGVGILVDGAGNDRYRCGVFGQGIAYWYALGMLVDLEGNDEYEGSWYVQASAAHYGVGALCDLGGNDRYLSKLTMGHGAGHDFSTAWFRDAAGNDHYDCRGAGLGFALYNGIGIFQDQAGDDIYKSGASAFGATGETRPESLSFGVFVDVGGTNLFPKDGRAKPLSTWTQPANKDQPHSHGIGASR